MEERRRDVAAGAGAGKVGAGEGAGGGGAVGRRYPKPPGLPLRLVQLCLKPESWAEAARYPMWMTVIALAVAIVVGAGLTGWGFSDRVVKSVVWTGKNYDAHYPPLEISSDGVLSVKGDLKAPIELLDGALVVDPLGAATEDKEPRARVLVTATEVQTAPFGTTMGLKDSPLTARLVPAAGAAPTVIDGKAITGYVEAHGTELRVESGVLMFLFSVIREGVWSLFMILLVSPLVMMAAAAGGKGLLLPRRVSYRITAAVLVPLVIFGGVTEAAGYPLSGIQEIGALSTTLWFVAAMALGIWAGVLAKRMYVPVRKGGGG